MGGSRFWNLAMKRLRARGSSVDSRSRVGRVGIGRGPLLLLLVVASITAGIKSMRHPNEFIHLVYFHF